MGIQYRIRIPKKIKEKYKKTLIEKEVEICRNWLKELQELEKGKELSKIEEKESY